MALGKTRSTCSCLLVALSHSAVWSTKSTVVVCDLLILYVQGRLQAVLLCLRYVDDGCRGYPSSVCAFTSWCAQKKQVPKQEGKDAKRGRENISVQDSVRTKHCSHRQLSPESGLKSQRISESYHRRDRSYITCEYITRMIRDLCIDYRLVYDSRYLYDTIRDLRKCDARCSVSM